MVQAISYEHIFGVDPNASAGQRAVKCFATPFLGQPSAFVNVGYGSFTLHIRVLDPGWHANGVGYFFFEIGNIVGYRIGIGPVSNQYFRFFLAGAPVATSNVPYVRDGQFHSFTVVRNSVDSVTASDPANTKLYYDGLLVSNVTKNIIPGNDYNANPEPGSKMGVGGGNNPCKSYIDRFYFYDRALSDAEVAQLDSPNRTVVSAKMLHEFNQLSSYVALDTSSVRNDLTVPDYMGGVPGGPFDVTAMNRFWFRTDAIKLIASNVVLQPPLSGHFMPSEAVLVKGIAIDSADPAGGGLTAVEYSIDGIAWSPLAFDGSGLSTPATFQPVIIDPASPQPTLYLRATNSNPAFLGCIELITS